MAHPSLADRTAGVLLHVTSLPGPHGSGDLGRAAHAFVDWVGRAKLGIWQMLPNGPAGHGNSPYSAHSSFAGSPMLVGLEALVEEGLLPSEALPVLPARRTDWAVVAPAREATLRLAFSAFVKRPARARSRLDAFARRARPWLADWALYAALKRAHGDGPWIDWPGPLRARKPAALAEARRRLAEEIRFQVFCQWRFDEDWTRLRAHAHDVGVALVGDVPIFVAHDSADVWAHRELFRLDADGHSTHISGVPPDYFSVTGQRWGNPLYRWPRLRGTGYRWWIDRLAITLSRFDVVRLDHFIGFQRYWEVAASEPTAQNGRWQPGPGAHFFAAVRRKLGRLPLIAEDLGATTPAVKALRDKLELPGIKVLQFAFGTDPLAPDFLPHAYPRRTVAYTGTHDNDTTVGWYQSIAESERAAARRYLAADGNDIAWDAIRAIFMSVANQAIVPMQDFLSLGSETRMNLPGTPQGNWEWRLPEGEASDGLAAKIADLVQTYGRDWKTP